MRCARHILLASLFFCIMPGIAAAQAPGVSAAPARLEFSGWIPYWQTEQGVAEAKAHLGQLTEINPFGYIVQADGTLSDPMGIRKEPWISLIAAAKQKKVRVIPTVIWSDGAQIDALMRDQSKRAAHIQNLYDMVMQNNFDGLDIDYEGKWAETREYYSLFLQELYKKMGNKWVMCTIEPRTPLEARYDTIPEDIEYANDFAVLNKNCDRVRIMTYDQGTIDLPLNRAQGGKPYIPLSDPKWVEKVITLAAKDIAKRKIVLGVPTYGYEYKMAPLTQGHRYDRQWSLNPRYALDLALELGLRPQRNAAGELSFTYLPSLRKASDTSQTLPNAAPFNLSPSKKPQAAAVALALEPIHLVWWSDAQAIKQKVDLARKLGIRGVAMFKIDGGADPAVWSVLK